MASAVLQTFVRKMSSSAAKEIKHVTIIGGGLMGSGIAQVIHLVHFQYFKFDYETAPALVVLQEFRESTAGVKVHAYQGLCRLPATVSPCRSSENNASRCVCLSRYAA